MRLSTLKISLGKAHTKSGNSVAVPAKTEGSGNEIYGRMVVSLASYSDPPVAPEQEPDRRRLRGPECLKDEPFHLGR